LPSDSRIAIPYVENYIEECFEVWYASGRPQATKFIESDACPVDRYNRKPVRRIIEEWVNERGWRERADVLDAQAETKINDKLVALKVHALNKQASQAAAVRQLAFDYLLENGFDSSASAVAAFIKASEMELGTLGVSKTLKRLSEMQDDEVLSAVKELAERAGATTIIDASEVQEEDAEPLD
jgi:hypothetical protein